MNAAKKPCRVGKVVKSNPITPASFQPAVPAFDAKTVAEQLDLWRLEGIKGSHARRSANGEFMVLSGDDFNRLLRRHGVRLRPLEGEVLSDADQLKDYLQDHRRVDATMDNLAGYGAGVYQVSGAFMMVKKSPRLIQPVAGDCSLILRLIERMLPEENGWSQVMLFHAWMKHCLDQKVKRGLALIIAGPIDCGKSMLPYLIASPLLGGRSADPGPHMFGDTDFNAELFGSEHLQMEDPAPKHHFSRTVFAENIKRIVANNTARFHPKGRDAITLTPKWHLSISLNDEPETMKILPELREDVADKILMLRAQRPFEDELLKLPQNHEREEFAQRIASVLPAYVHYLNRLTVPEAYQGARFGVKAWQNPSLSTDLFDSTPAGRLLALIDETFLWTADMAEGMEQGCGSFAEIRTEMERHITWGDEAKGFFKVNRIEQLLGRLVKSHPTRIERHRITSGNRKGNYYWKVMAPKPAVV